MNLYRKALLSLRGPEKSERSALLSTHSSQFISYCPFFILSPLLLHSHLWLQLFALALFHAAPCKAELFSQSLHPRKSKGGCFLTLKPPAAISIAHNSHQHSLHLQDTQLKFHWQYQQHKKQVLELLVLYRHFLTGAYLCLYNALSSP